AYDAAGPGYLAYIPGGGLFAAGVGDLIANCINRFTNLAAPSPALVQIEANVVRWLCDLFGFPPTSQGILTTGGSMANFSAVITARSAKLPENFLDGTIYVTEHVHHSMAKSARLAGFPARAMRIVPSDANLRMDVSALRDAIAADRAGGLMPFLVVASAGTTNTGAVDPIADIAEVARTEGLWCHVDAAYGGFFQLTERGRAHFAGIDGVDSITLDPHKGMFLPYGTGSLLVRDGASLQAAHRVGAQYLPHASSDTAIPDFADFSPELSRDYRGLRVWLPLSLHGVDAFRSALDEKLDLTRLVYEALSSAPNLVVPWEPDLSIVAFHPASGDNEAAARLLARINDSKRIFISDTIVDGRSILRVCILSHRTHRDRIEEGIEIIQKAAVDL
ncbi:MAG: pyridoxal phosphate-dependent decarboxylase family protein, partial [Actinomycetota bacterium]